MLPDASAVRSELDKILGSPVFARSPRLSRFLRYVVEQTLEGRSDCIKEYTIAIEVFDKGKEFDQQSDSTVRTEATKLRARLSRYYETDGAVDPIVITIPKGTYIPVMEERRQTGIPLPAKRLSHAWHKRSLAARAALIAVLGCIMVVAGVSARKLLWTRGAVAGKTQPLAVSPVAEAQRHYERARHFESFGTAASLTKAIDEYLLCLARDPNFAHAHADLSMAYSRLMEVDTRPFRDLPKLATVAALKAVELDRTLAAAHHAAARAHVAAWNWKGAEPEFLLALKLDPGSTAVMGDYATLYLNMMGRYDEAVKLLRQGVALNPTSRTLRTGIGGALLQAGRYDEAIAAYTESLDLQETPGTLTFIGCAFAAQGRYEEALERQQRAKVLNPTDPWIVGHLAYTFARSGRIQKAKEHLAELREMARDDLAIAVELAGVYSGLGDRDQAFLWLKRALEARSPRLRWLRGDPRFVQLRDDERFRDTLQTVGLPVS